MDIAGEIDKNLKDNVMHVMFHHVSRNVTSLFDVIYECLQNANDAAGHDAPLNTFTMSFDAKGFSLTHNLGLWTNKDIIAFFSWGGSTKNERKDKSTTGEMGVGSFCAFRYATLAKLQAPTGEGLRSICYHWREGILSESTEDCNGPSASLTSICWEQISDDLGYHNALQELFDTIDDDYDMSIPLLGIPFLFNLREIRINVDIDGKHAGLYLQKEYLPGEKLHECIIRGTLNETPMPSKTLWMYKAKRDDLVCTVAFDSSPLNRNIPKLYRTLPLQRSESIDISMYIDGPFDHDTSRKLSPFLASRLSSPGYQFVIETIMEALQAYRNCSNAHLLVFPAHQPLRRGWGAFIAKVRDEIRSRNEPFIFIRGDYVPVTELVLGEICCGDVIWPVEAMGLDSAVIESVEDQLDKIIATRSELGEEVFDVLKGFFGLPAIKAEEFFRCLCRTMTTEDFVAILTEVFKRTRARSSGARLLTKSLSMGMDTLDGSWPGFSVLLADSVNPAMHGFLLAKGSVAGGTLAEFTTLATTIISRNFSLQESLDTVVAAHESTRLTTQEAVLSCFCFFDTSRWNTSLHKAYLRNAFDRLLGDWIPVLEKQCPLGGLLANTVPIDLDRLGQFLRRAQMIRVREFAESFIASEYLPALLDATYAALRQLASARDTVCDEVARDVVDFLGTLPGYPPKVKDKIDKISRVRAFASIQGKPTCLRDLHLPSKEALVLADVDVFPFELDIDDLSDVGHLLSIVGMCPLQAIPKRLIRAKWQPNQEPRSQDHVSSLVPAFVAYLRDNDQTSISLDQFGLFMDSRGIMRPIAGSVVVASSAEQKLATYVFPDAGLAFEAQIQGTRLAPIVPSLASRLTEFLATRFLQMSIGEIDQLEDLVTATSLGQPSSESIRAIKQRKKDLSELEWRARGFPDANGTQRSSDKSVWVCDATEIRTINLLLPDVGVALRDQIANTVLEKEIAPATQQLKLLLETHLSSWDMSRIIEVGHLLRNTRFAAEMPDVMCQLQRREKNLREAHERSRTFPDASGTKRTSSESLFVRALDEVPIVHKLWPQCGVAFWDQIKSTILAREMVPIDEMLDRYINEAILQRRADKCSEVLQLICGTRFDRAPFNYSACLADHVRRLQQRSFALAAASPFMELVKCFISWIPNLVWILGRRSKYDGLPEPESGVWYRDYVVTAFVAMLACVAFAFLLAESGWKTTKAITSVTAVLFTLSAVSGVLRRMCEMTLQHPERWLAPLKAPLWILAILASCSIALFSNTVTAFLSFPKWVSYAGEISAIFGTCATLLLLSQRRLALGVAFILLFAVFAGNVVVGFRLPEAATPGWLFHLIGRSPNVGPSRSREIVRKPLQRDANGTATTLSKESTPPLASAEFYHLNEALRLIREIKRICQNLERSPDKELEQIEGWFQRRLTDVKSDKK